MNKRKSKCIINSEDSSIDLYNRFLLHIRNESEKAKNTAFYLGTGENDRPKGGRSCTAKRRD